MLVFSKQKILSLSIFLLIPFFANANVVINEVAWMGTVNSASDEWIELYNNGNEDVDLNGCILKAQDDTLLINLSGIIKTKSFFLLERTDDTTIPDISADIVYTGALSNNGEILILKNNDIEIDKVDASSGWLAGDNITKQTMQRIVSGGWITSDPTPKAQNSSEDHFEPVAEKETEQEQQTKTTDIIAWPTEPQIYANAGADKTAIVGADVYFAGKTLGLEKEPLENARYLWNFGDGAIAEGQNVKHIYKYPGEYIVVLDASSGKYSASDRLTAKIIPNQLEIIEANQNYIKLHNSSSVELDISQWFLRAENILFKFPENTFMKTNKDLMIDFSVSGIKAENQKVELLYPNGSVAREFVDGLVLDESKQQQTRLPELKQELSQGIQQENVDTENSVSDKSDIGAENNQISGVVAAMPDEDNGPGDSKKWFIFPAVLGVFAAGGFLFIKRQSIV